MSIESSSGLVAGRDDDAHAPGRALPEIVAVTCWGVRGTLPVPGPMTASFGGHTACVEIAIDDGRRLILDAGTGILRLSERFRRYGMPIDIFLTSLSIEHVHGLAFFAPAYDEHAQLRIYGPAGGKGLGPALGGLIRKPLFPLGFEEYPAQIRCGDVEHGRVWNDRGIEVAAFHARQGGGALGYRVRAGGRTVAYFPGNELVGGAFDTPADWYADLVQFVYGADLLIHDATYLASEYPRFAGQGHSTPEHAVSLAEEAAVQHLCLFRHAPHRNDRDIVKALNTVRETSPVSLRLSAAQEGWQIRL